jgi:hypothetical protein
MYKIPSSFVVLNKRGQFICQEAEFMDPNMQNNYGLLSSRKMALFVMVVHVAAALFMFSYHTLGFTYEVRT